MVDHASPQEAWIKISSVTDKSNENQILMGRRPCATPKWCTVKALDWPRRMRIQSGGVFFKSPSKVGKGPTSDKLKFEMA